MDFSHSSVAVSVGLSAGSLNFGERNLSSLTTELAEARQRMSGHTMSPGVAGMLSPSNPLKQCRSASEMDMDLRDDRRGGAMKLARTDSFTSRQPDLKMQMNSSGTLGSLVRSNSMVPDGRLGRSPTNSSASDGVLLSNETSLVSEPRLMRNDSIVSCPTYSGGTPRPLSYHHQAYPFRPSGLPLSMIIDSIGHLGLHDLDREPPPFTSNQWREFLYHSTIYKYIASGVSIPADLLYPIRSSVVGLAGMPTAAHHLANMGWGNYHIGFSNNPDPEPGRCRRTDGKKWRCSKDVVPDQKYCEKHMHRGRHRARKPAENQTTSSSQPISVTPASSGGASSVSLAAAARGTTATGLRPTIAGSNQQHHSSGLGVKSYSGPNSPNNSGGISFGSSNNGSQYQLPLQTVGGTPGLPTKDFRFLNGVTKTEIDLGTEQMFFSEASGSARGLGQESQQLNGLSMLSSVNNSWRTMSSKQQHSFLGGGFGGVDAVNVGREPEGQPLRHFFDDWPRSRDPTTLTWSDVEEERSNRSSSTTQLSISIPMASSDFTASNGSSPRGKLSLSPLKLSMSRASDDDPLGVDPTQMGLGMGMGLGMNEDRHRQTNWIPVAWEASVGGPLAEVLQSSTPRGCKSSGLNLMTEGWDNSPRESSRLASPTGVLQNSTFGTFSDSSSGSSPRALKIEAGLCDKPPEL